MHEFGFIKSSEDIYLYAYLASFPQSTECLILDLHPEFLQGCWRSVAAVAIDLILAEADGKCQLLVGRALSG